MTTQQNANDFTKCGMRCTRRQQGLSFGNITAKSRSRYRNQGLTAPRSPPWIRPLRIKYEKLLLMSIPTTASLERSVKHIAPDSEFVWTIDPIDGTLPFLAGIPVFGTLAGIAPQ